MKWNFGKQQTAVQGIIFFCITSNFATCSRNILKISSPIESCFCHAYFKACLVYIKTLKFNRKLE